MYPKLDNNASSTAGYLRHFAYWGMEQPSGYTARLLHAWHLTMKAAAVAA